MFAMAIMVLEIMFMGFLAGAGSAASGNQGGYHTANWMVIFFVLSLVAYLFRIVPRGK